MAAMFELRFRSFHWSNFEMLVHICSADKSDMQCHPLINRLTQCLFNGTRQSAYESINRQPTNPVAWSISALTACGILNVGRSPFFYFNGCISRRLPHLCPCCQSIRFPYLLIIERGFNLNFTLRHCTPGNNKFNQNGVEIWTKAGYCIITRKLSLSHAVSYSNYSNPWSTC